MIPLQFIQYECEEGEIPPFEDDKELPDGSRDESYIRFALEAMRQYPLKMKGEKEVQYQRKLLTVKDGVPVHPLDGTGFFEDLEERCPEVGISEIGDINIEAPNTERLHSNRSLLLYLNSSRMLSKEELSKRFSVAEASDGGEAKAGLRVPYRTLKACVSGKDVGPSTMKVCEGQLLRATLGATSISDVFGYAEAWLCVASYMLEFEKLKPVLGMLWQFYFYAYEQMEEEERCCEDRCAAMELACELYTDLCCRILEARRHLPRGCYELKDRDCLVDIFHGPGGDYVYINSVEAGASRCLTLATYKRRVLERTGEVCCNALVKRSD